MALKQQHVTTCANFLKRINKGEIRGYISLVVLDEILFKLIQFEVSGRYKIPLRSAVKYIKDNPDCIEGLTKCWEGIDTILSMNITVLDLPSNFQLIVDTCRRHKVLTKDSIHIATMKSHGIKNIATSDMDFRRIEGIEVWCP